nr:hypothetical protein [Tanacetum cinerariifolium]
MQTPGKGTRIVEGGPTSDPMSLEKTWGQENEKESFTISHEHLDQYVTMGTTLTTNCKQLLADVLRENKEEGLIRKVQYPEWIANTIPIKLANRTWKVQIYYSSLNKVCAKDMYPYRRMMEKVLANQRGRNVETYLEEIVIKSKSEMDFVQVVKETLRKLKKSKHQDRSNHVLVRSEGRKVFQPYEKEGIQIPVSYVSHRCKEWKYDTPQLKKRVQALINTARSLRTVFRKHKVKVATDGSMEETIKLIGREGRLGKWVTKIRTYDISYIQRKEAKGPVMTKFFSKWEQVEETPDANKGGIFDLSKGFQANLTPTTRARRLYLGRETIEEGSCIGIILISPKQKMYSDAIRLKFKASNHAMDCEALLVRLAASANQGMKDLHVFIDSLTLVTHVEGNHTPRTKQERRTDNYKARILQPGSISRYQNKTIDRRDNQQQERQATSKALGAKPNYNHEASGSN